MLKNLFIATFSISMLSAQAQTLFPVAKHKTATSKYLRSADVAIQRLDSMATYKYEDSNTRPFELIHYKYDVQGNNTEFWVYSTYSGTKRLSSSATYTYDQNIIRTETTSSYDTTTGNLSSKYEMEYDETGKIISSIYYDSSPNSPNLSYDSKTLYNYVGDRLVEDREYRYINNAWMDVFRTDYIYDASGNNTAQLGYNVPSNLLVEKKIMQYDPSGNLILTEDSITEGGAWILERKQSSTWDEHGNLTSQTFYTWDPQLRTAVLSSKLNYNYDTSVDPSALIHPNNISGYFNNKSTGAILYIYDDGSWSQYLNVEMYYNNLRPMSIHDETADNSSIYVHDNTLYVQEAKNNERIHISMYDQQGRVLLNQDLDHGGISLQSFTSGMYMYRLTQSSRTSTGKIWLK